MKNLLIANLRKSFYLKLIPFFSCFMLLTFSCVIYPPSGFSLSIPYLVVAGIIYWHFLLGKVFSIFEIFLIGVIADLYMGTPLGYYSLLFLLMTTISFITLKKIGSRKIFFNFLLAAYLYAIFFSLEFVFVFIYHDAILNLNILIFNFLISCSIYPIIYILFRWLYVFFNLDTIYAEN